MNGVSTLRQKTWWKVIVDCVWFLERWCAWPGLVATKSVDLIVTRHSGDHGVTLGPIMELYQLKYCRSSLTHGGTKWLIRVHEGDHDQGSATESSNDRATRHAGDPLSPYPPSLPCYNIKVISVCVLPIHVWHTRLKNTLVWNCRFFCAAWEVFWIFHRTIEIVSHWKLYWCWRSDQMIINDPAPGRLAGTMPLQMTKLRHKY